MSSTTKISCEWRGKMAFDVELPTGTIHLDSSVENGGDDKGHRPKSLMLVALAGCTAMDVSSLMTKMNAKPEDFKIEILAELSEEHPKIYQKVKILYHFWGKDLKKDKLEKSVNLSLDRYCGVTAMFRKFAEVTHEILYYE